jgi:hypothetical protein
MKKSWKSPEKDVLRAWMVWNSYIDSNIFCSHHRQGLRISYHMSLLLTPFRSDIEDFLLEAAYFRELNLAFRKFCRQTSFHPTAFDFYTATSNLISSPLIIGPCSAVCFLDRFKQSRLADFSITLFSVRFFIYNIFGQFYMALSHIFIICHY